MNLQDLFREFGYGGLIIMGTTVVIQTIQNHPLESTSMFLNIEHKAFIINTYFTGLSIRIYALTESCNVCFLEILALTYGSGYGPETLII